jgi:hypothetical protein
MNQKTLKTSTTEPTVKTEESKKEPLVQKSFDSKKPKIAKHSLSMNHEGLVGGS